MSIATLMWPYVERSIEAIVAMFERATEHERQWRPSAPNTNSLATLASHTVGNAEDNLLQTIGGIQIAYERESDFNDPQLSGAALRERWESVRSRFAMGLPELTDAIMLESVEHPRRGAVTRLETLLVVARHAVEHRAHAELTRDLYEAWGSTGRDSD